MFLETEATKKPMVTKLAEPMIASTPTRAHVPAPPTLTWNSSEPVANTRPAWMRETNSCMSTREPMKLPSGMGVALRRRSTPRSRYATKVPEMP